MKVVNNASMNLNAAETTQFYTNLAAANQPAQGFWKANGIDPATPQTTISKTGLPSRYLQRQELAYIQTADSSKVGYFSAVPDTVPSTSNGNQSNNGTTFESKAIGSPMFLTTAQYDIKLNTDYDPATDGPVGKANPKWLGARPVVNLKRDGVSVMIHMSVNITELARHTQAASSGFYVFKILSADRSIASQLILGKSFFRARAAKGMDYDILNPFLGAATMPGWTSMVLGVVTIPWCVKYVWQWD